MKTGAGGPADRDRRAFELFQAALALGHSEVEAFLERECGDDAALREQVEDLLAIDLEGSTAPLEEVVAEAIELESGSLESIDALPLEIAGYRRTGILGEGGMGVVFRARSDHPRRDVALKVARTGLSGKPARARFEREIELLGQLEYPGIARLYDAGHVSAGGLEVPYFVMELVDGVPLDAWVARAEPDLTARTRVLARIAKIVAHAHERGIVHRDLKPQNVLVDGSDQPHLIDFGIARALHGDLGFTSTMTLQGEFVGTPTAMSPEQVEGDPSRIDARTDVYALGALAYQVLAGRPALDLVGRSLPAIARAVLQEEPEPLGRVDPALRGDLETIVGKALDKDPAQRYANAGELAADLERTLRHEPIAARPPSPCDRAVKFVKRHTGLTVGVGLALVALAAGTAVSMNQARRASARATEAERNLLSARQTAAVVFEMLKASNPAFSSGPAGSRDALDRASSMVGEVHDPGLRAPLLVQIGVTYLMQQRPDRARPLLEEAEALLAGGAANLLDEDARSLFGSLGGLAHEEKRHADAIAYFERAAEFDREGEDLAPELNLIRTRLETGQVIEARAAFDSLPLSCGPVVDGAHQGCPRHQTTLAVLRTRILDGEGELEQAIAAGFEALELFERTDRLGGFQHQDLLRVLPRLLARGGRHLEAVPLLEELLAYEKERDGPDALSVARTLTYLQEVEPDPLASYEWGQEALAVYRRAEVHSSNFGVALSNQAGYAERLGLAEEGLALRFESVAVLRDCIDPVPSSTARAERDLARTLRRNGRIDEALEYFEASLRHYRAEGPPDLLGSALVDLGATLLDAGRAADALPLLREGGAVRAEILDADDWRLASTRGLEGYALFQLGRLDEAGRILEVVQGQLERALPAHHPRVTIGRGHLEELERARSDSATQDGD